MLITATVVYKGVNKGIEKYSKILMPILFVLIAGISVFSITLKHTNADGVTRTGMQGLAIYLIPNFRGMTVKKFPFGCDGCIGTAFLLDQRGDGNYGYLRILCEERDQSDEVDQPD